ncbi:MAG: PLP-dependent cysteine synthase family protein [Steroidobacteraceae bacterium]
MDLIGRTPMLALRRAYVGRGVILAKAEFLNPGGSIKDRAALAIIRGALERGELVEGQPLASMTSGNLGAGLALVCSVLGHPFLAFMSEGNSPARARMMEALGASVKLVAQVDGVPGRVTGADIAAAASNARATAMKIGALHVDQFLAAESVTTHESGTGPEIWNQLEGTLDAFVACVGSAGPFVGMGRFLKSRAPQIAAVAVEPLGCEVLAGKALTKHTHLIQGTSSGLVPPLWDPSLMDHSVAVSDDEVVHWRERLGKREGLYVGYSAAANVCAAAKLLESGLLPDGARVVTLLCDTGLKY